MAGSVEASTHTCSSEYSRCSGTSRFGLLSFSSLMKAHSTSIVCISLEQCRNLLREVVAEPFFDHVAGDGGLSGGFHTPCYQLVHILVSGHPTRLQGLVAVHAHIGGIGHAFERHHERCGERPWLRSQIFEFADVYADLLFGFAPACVLQVLTRFHEACGHGIQASIAPCAVVLQQLPEFR
mgnify:CR=1 FL=1